MKVLLDYTNNRTFEKNYCDECGKVELIDSYCSAKLSNGAFCSIKCANKADYERVLGFKNNGDKLSQNHIHILNNYKPPHYGTYKCSSCGCNMDEQSIESKYIYNEYFCTQKCKAKFDCAIEEDRKAHLDVSNKINDHDDSFDAKAMIRQEEQDKILMTSTPNDSTKSYYERQLYRHKESETVKFTLDGSANPFYNLFDDCKDVDDVANKLKMTWDEAVLFKSLIGAVQARKLGKGRHGKSEDLIRDINKMQHYLDRIKKREANNNAKCN